MMSPIINKVRRQYVRTKIAKEVNFNQKGLKVCHAHNMRKKIQRDLSTYLKRPKDDVSSLLKRSRWDFFHRLEAII